MLSKVGRYSFTVEPFHCDFQHQLFLGHLGNHLLNAADYHSDERGYGISYLNKQQRTWVLSRFAMELAEMPKAYDKIVVETWVDKVMRYFTSRNFAITSEQGKVYGYGRSIWAMIDTQTRQPVDIMQVGKGIIMDYVEDQKQCPIAAPLRVKTNPLALPKHSFRAQYSDVDINGHVNSVKYIDHILDLWDTEWYSQHRVERFDIAYIAESHCGDQLSLSLAEEGDETYSVGITKPSGDAQKNIEVCKSSIKFMKI